MRATASLLLALGACSASSGPSDALTYDKPRDAGQPEYAYPGCAKEDGPTCPRTGTVRCALSLVSQGQMICTEDYDCELLWLNPRCLSLCEPSAVNFDNLPEARAGMQQEIDRYCRMGPCAEPACADAGGASWAASCYQGFCAAVRPDAGLSPDAAEPADAGPPDA